MEKLKSMGIWKKTVTILLGIFLMSILVCGLIFAYIFIHRQNVQQEELVRKADSETKSSIEAYFREIDEVAYNVAYSSWMQKIFDVGLKENERRKRVDEAVNFMNTLAFLNSDVQFSIFTQDGMRFNSNAWFILNPEFEITEQSWFDILDQEGHYIWSGENQPVFYRNESWCIMPFYTVNNYNSLEREAYLSVNIPLDTFSKNIFGKYEYRGCYQALLNTDGEYIYSEIPKELMQNVFSEGVTQGREYTVMKSEILIGTESYYLISMLENAKAAPENEQIWFIFVGIIGFMGVILFVAACSISMYITKPLANCRDAMLAISNNHLGLQVENPYSDEFGEMLESFNQMSGSISDLIEKNKAISMMQKEAEYKLLERQIHPHFLFNTLELINGLIMNGEEEAARKVCETLGELYHYHLSPEKYISLKEEMEYTKKYLYLMTYKVHDLSFYYDLDQELRDMQILRVVLQPLVENAIKHGFCEKNREHCITLTAERMENMDVKFTVMDNGCGMEEDALCRLRKQIEEICENPQRNLEYAEHIGIKNVTQRMALEYGEQFSIQINSKKEYGVRIELILKGVGENVSGLYRG